MKKMRKIIHIDRELCDGCGQCVPSCAEGSIQIINGKAKVVSDNLCDGLGACLGHCPQGALNIVEREADEFDPEAVERFLAEKAAKEQTDRPGTAPICPSAMTHSLQPQPARQNKGPRHGTALSHWPVQIRLVPPTAPFLKDADLLVTADCAAVSSPNFHADYLQGRVVMMGCPKFDDTAPYLDKFVEIFRSNPPRSITVLRMEVPCCGGLPSLITTALETAGADIPVRIITLSTSGDGVQPFYNQKPEG
ncbi:ATP-binding protein [Desulfoplanes sp.]